MFTAWADGCRSGVGLAEELPSMVTAKLMGYRRNLMRVALSWYETAASRLVVAVRVLLPSPFFSMCSVVV